MSETKYKFFINTLRCDKYKTDTFRCSSVGHNQFALWGSEEDPDLGQLWGQHDVQIRGLGVRLTLQLVRPWVHTSQGAFDQKHKRWGKQCAPSTSGQCDYWSRVSRDCWWKTWDSWNLFSYSLLPVTTVPNAPSPKPWMEAVLAINPSYQRRINFARPSPAQRIRGLLRRENSLTEIALRGTSTRL